MAGITTHVTINPHITLCIWISCSVRFLIHPIHACYTRLYKLLYKNNHIMFVRSKIINHSIVVAENRFMLMPFDACQTSKMISLDAWLKHG